MRKLAVVAIVGLATTAGLAAAAQGALAASGSPRSIPAPQHWNPGGAGYSFGAGTRVVVPEARLAGTAELFAGELRTLTGVAVPWLLGEPARAGDIELRIGPADGGPEGYRLTVGSAVLVQGAGDAGVFYGTRTLLQWLRQARTLPGGTVFSYPPTIPPPRPRSADWPVYPERGLMLDVGRKYLPPEYLRARIRELAYLKLNHLHLHLSDNLGFRLASQTHPEVTSAQHYTKREIRELVGYAARYHVEVLPEIDMPGHMDAILAAHPRLKLVSRSGVVHDGLIDLSKPAALDLMRDLITEFLPLFPGRYWHIGADEYVTDYADFPQLGGRDAFHRFVNWANGIVRAAGKTTRMWNDGLEPGSATVPVSPDIIVEHWSAGGRTPWHGPALSPSQLVAAGHRVQNAAFTPTYYTTGGPAAPFNVPPGPMYDAWRPTVFVDGSSLPEDRILGALVHVWCDDPNARTEAEIAAAIHDRLRVLAQHTWGSPRPAPLYVLFRPLINAVGDAPG